MSPSIPLTARVWFLIPLYAVGFLIWTGIARLRHVEYVTAIAQEEIAVAATSPTGYTGGTRELIVPEHLSESYGWIAQTQLMLHKGDWRVRHIDYENAPSGREEHASSPYRWWLGLLAWIDHLISGRPLGLSVERAALFADPLLHLLFLAIVIVFVARQFGVWSGALFSLGGVTLYPFAAAFLPGVPDDYSLTLVCAFGSVGLLLAGTRHRLAAGAAAGAEDARRRAGRWFLCAGIAGGLGLWINVASQWPVLAGIGLGAMLAAGIRRSATTQDAAGDSTPAHWRTWALGGAATVLGGYLIEYSPADLGDLQLRVVHPLYGLCWLGAGELLARTEAWGRRTEQKWTFRDLLQIMLVAAGLAVVPVVMWRTGNPGVFAVDLRMFRLTKLPDAILSPSFPLWLSRDGLTATVWATLAPLILLLPAGWLMLRRATATPFRVSLALALGPVLVVLGLACLRIRTWQMVDGTMLALLCAATAAIGGTSKAALPRWLWAAAVVLVLVPGAILLLPPMKSAASNVLTVPEVEGLVERDFAHWLARHIGAANPGVVLAPPNVTNTLYYYGGLRGLGTLAWENKDGLSVALRIAISTSTEEAHALVRRRGVTHIIVPSWDTFFEDYTASAAVQPGELFLTSLHRWRQPSWLRPIPYQLPTIAGFEAHSVMVFEVVDEQDDAVALGRLTEYFIEMGQLENAKAAGQALRRFPFDFSSLVARAQLDAARGDATEFASTLDQLLKRLAAAADRGLLWDRRVSLGVVLARGKRMDLARVQVQQCLAEIDEARLRSVTTYSLFHLLGLSKAFGLGIADPHLQSLARDLLPSDLRRQL